MDHIEISNLKDSKWRKIRHKYVKSKNFDSNNRTSNLLDTKKVLDNLQISFWLTNGTALGAYREKDFIPWDDDIDLDVYEENLLPNYAKLKEGFLSLGFIVRGTCKKKNCKMAIFRYGEKTALRGLFLDKTYKKNKFRLRKSYKYPRKFYENDGFIIFKNCKFRIPSPIEDFLVYAYGKKWNIPLKSDKESVYSTKDIRR